MSVSGKLPDPDRAEKVLRDPELYFAEARKRNREAILRDDAARRRRGGSRPRYA